MGRGDREARRKQNTELLLILFFAVGPKIVAAVYRACRDTINSPATDKLIKITNMLCLSESRERFYLLEIKEISQKKAGNNVKI